MSANTILFYILATIIIGGAIMAVTSLKIFVQQSIFCFHSLELRDCISG